MLKETKFKHDELVIYRLKREIKGIIMSIIYHSRSYYTYNVQWETGEISSHKESELISEEENLRI